MPDLSADRAAVHTFLSTRYGGIPGLFQVCSDPDNWTGRFFNTDTVGIDRATAYVMELDASKVRGIYSRMTTVTGLPGQGKRGQADDSFCFSGLWSDLDFGTVGHKGSENPPDPETAHKVYQATGLPKATILVNSGGGLYHHVLLGKSVDIRDPETRERVKNLSQRWQAHIENTAKEMGFTYGRGVSDLARVLRIPGTVNRKAPDNPRPAQARYFDNRYSLEELEAALPAPQGRRYVAGGGRSGGHRAQDSTGRLRELLRGVQRGATVQEDLRVLVDTFRTNYERDGGRNNALYILAGAAFQYAAAEQLDFEDVKEAFTEAAYELEMDTDTGGAEAIEKTLESAERYGRNNPRAFEPRRTPTDPEKYFARIEGTRTFLAATLATDVLDIGPLAAGIDSLLWQYREGVWVPSKDVARHRAANLLGENYRRSYAVNAEDVVRSRIPDIECEPISEVINFRNGLYYWQTGILAPHSPDVLSTVQLSVDWEPAATCPEFDAFLGQVLHADTVDMMWELIGYLMYSGNPLHKAVMLTGSGRNGKGTFLRVLETLLGKQNISSASLTDLVSNRFATASLFGKIANIAGDIDGTYLETTGVFKNITGLDSIRAEHKGRDGFEFTPWAVPVFSANKIPGSADTTVGYLSRWVIQHFPHNFEGREDRTLDQRLQTKSELAGIAAKAVPALKRLMARGDFELSTSAQEAREEFIRRVDQVRTWISECTAPDPASWSPRTALYAVYKNWAARDGHGTLKATEFYDRLESAGVRPAKVNGNRGFAGIRVTDTAEGTGRPR
ncbi:phage/plasmid primase, P4 family [Streptomyces sp. NPDC052107]|uniref:DNA primase family protein n=1 Tax=Streptomyces sp. NPDC052107 TaxID=3155632 RepID=UPI0034296596